MKTPQQRSRWMTPITQELVSPGPNCISKTASAATASGLSAEQVRVWTVALRPLTSRSPPSNGLHLREAAIHKQFRSCDERPDAVAALAVFDMQLGPGETS